MQYIDCNINPISRVVSYPGATIVQRDTNVEALRFHFSLDAEYELENDSIRIMVLKDGKTNGFNAENVRVETNDGGDEELVFEHTITTHETATPGQIAISVCGNQVSGNNITEAWHTLNMVFQVSSAAHSESDEGEDTPETIASNAEKIAALQTLVDAITSGRPIPVDLKSKMTDTSAIYLYTGSETGEQHNYWYYHDGTSWVPGSEYGGMTIDDELSSTSENAVQNKVIKANFDEVNERLHSLQIAVGEKTKDGSDFTLVTDGTADLTKQGSDFVITGATAANEFVAAFTDIDGYREYVVTPNRYNGTPATATIMFPIYYDGTYIYCFRFKDANTITVQKIDLTTFNASATVTASVSNAFVGNQEIKVEIEEDTAKLYVEEDLLYTYDFSAIRTENGHVVAGYVCSLYTKSLSDNSRVAFSGFKVYGSSGIESIQESIGDLANLSTTDKSSIVAAINELSQSRPSIAVDSALSDSSENPVQNKVIKAAVDSVETSIVSLGGVVDGLKSDVHSVAIVENLNGWDSVDYIVGYLSPGGSIVSNITFRTTDFIPVTEGDTITYKLQGFNDVVCIIGAFSSEKVIAQENSVIGSSTASEGIYTVPSGIEYVRLSSGSVANARFTSETIKGKNIIDTKEYIDGLNSEVNQKAETALESAETAIERSANVDGVMKYYTVSPNLLDPSKLTPAGGIGAGYYYSDYIPVIAGNRYCISSDGAIYKVYYYTEAKDTISNVTINAKGMEITAPAESAFIRLAYRAENATHVMFTTSPEGDFKPYGELYKISELPAYVERYTNNLLTDKYISNANISANTGGVITYDNGRATDFIPVDAGDKLYFRGNKTGAAIYDSSYQFIAAISSFPYEVPSGAAYVRVGYTVSGSIIPCLRKNNDGVSGISTFDEYDTYRIIKTKPTAYEVNNGLYGKKWNAMGDSITEGSGTTKTYMGIIAERSGVIVRNYGVSNTAIAKRGTTSTNDMWARYTAMDDDADIITVFGGTNDHGNNVPIGQWGDATETTLYGALKILVEGLINKYMGKRIGFITPIPKYNPNNNTDFSYPSESFKPYIDCIKDVCARYSIPVLDLYTQSGISPGMASVRTALIPDGLHPNLAGHELISWKIQRFIESI